MEFEYLQMRCFGFAREVILSISGVLWCLNLKIKSWYQALLKDINHYNFNTYWIFNLSKSSELNFQSKSIKTLSSKYSYFDDLHF